jgi:ribosomal protein L40E
VKSYATPKQLCLRCGYYMDHATNASGKGRPVPGDFSVCLNCGAVNMFDAKLNLVPSSVDAARDLLKPPAFQKLILSQLFIKQRGPIPKKDKPS